MALFPGSGLVRVCGIAAVAVLATSLTGCGKDVRNADVRLDAVRNATVVTAEGTERPAADGATLGKGDRVRTGKDGTATLVVRERRVVLGGATDVVVPDGAGVELTKGAVLVDRRRGPGLTVRAGDTTLERIGVGALRVERSLSVRVAGLSAGARLRTVTGNRLELGAFHQVGISGRAAPRGVVPLQLAHDAWEREVIPAVLEDDTFLNEQAAGLDDPGATIVPVTYTPQAGVRTSVALLSEAIGRAAADDPGAQRAAASRARDLRERGGSWGVVAALLETNAVEIGAALTGVLTGVPVESAGPSAPGASAGPTGGPGGPGVVAGATPQPPVNGGGPSPQPSRSPGGPGPTPTSTRPTQPTSSPTTSSPSSSSIQDEVLKVLPTPSVPPVVASAASILGL